MEEVLKNFCWTEQRKCSKYVMYIQHRNWSKQHHHPPSKLNTSSSSLNLCSKQKYLIFWNGQICLFEHLLWSFMKTKSEVSTNNLRQRYLKFFVKHLCCVHKVKGGGAQCKIFNTSSVFWKCVHCVHCRLRLWRIEIKGIQWLL